MPPADGELPAPSALTPAPVSDALQARRSLLGRLREVRERHQTAETALFFVAGFLLDIFTLDRIDSVFGIAQQGVYLAVLALLLIYGIRDELNLAKPPRLVAWAWRFSEGAIHFLLGSLLSAFSLFYFKSASGWVSLAFLWAMFALLVANELPRFRQLGQVVRLGLFGLCLTTYFSYVLPVLMGFLSTWLFLAAVALATALGGAFYRVAKRWSPDPAWATRRLWWPYLGIQALLVALYFGRAVPPIPLSVQQMGIYHQVEKQDGTFLLSHERPPWTPWRAGDQAFKARPGDRIYVFARIFAPTGFHDRVRVRWEYDSPRSGWTDMGSYGLSIVGGRAQGFRGFAYKENYRPGDWRVTLETEDGRAIGTLRFTVEEDLSTTPRQFQVEQA